LSWIHYNFYTFLIQRPHITTHVAYTTLFRSFRRVAEGVVDRLVVLVRAAADHVLTVGEQHDRLDPFVVIVRRPLGEGLVGRKQADRKSTRLNSSHVKISYAVFCLKRKNYSLPIATDDSNRRPSSTTLHEAGSWTTPPQAQTGNRVPDARRGVNALQ